MKYEDVRIDMEVHFCEPDLTSGLGKVVAIEKEIETGIVWVRLDWGYEVPAAYCTPTNISEYMAGLKKNYGKARKERSAR